MSQSSELKAVVVRKIKIKSKPVVAEEAADPKVGEPVAEKPKAVEEAPAVKKNHWMTPASQMKKVQPMAIIWEHVEDISDDENDTPQAAGKRLSTLKATRDQIQRRAYRSKVAELQFAGLFRNWAKPQPLETHSNYYYEVQSTYAHPISAQ
jgi:hypothetical protein